MSNLAARVSALETGPETFSVIRQCGRCKVWTAEPSTSCDEHPDPPPLHPGERSVIIERSYGMTPV
jgi:hypothetical protein